MQSSQEVFNTVISPINDLESIVDIANHKGARYNEEDTYLIMENVKIPNMGECNIYAVFDGHAGRDYADFASSDKGISTILPSKLLQVKSENDHDGIIAAFKEMAKDIQEMGPNYSGITLVLTLLVKSTHYTYNYSVGDCRWNYSDSLTGNIIVDSIREIDFALNTDTERIGSFTNIIHHIPGEIVCNEDSPVTNNNNLPVDDKNLQLFHVLNDDELGSGYKEWCAWNKSLSCNPEQIIKFPFFYNRCWRMKGIQSTRTNGDLGLTCTLGVLSIIEHKNIGNTTALWYCDGVDDNGASNPKTIAQYAHNFDLASQKFLDNHYCFTRVSSLEPRPDDNVDLVTKIEWIKSLFSGPLRNFDRDFRRSIDEALDFFKNNTVDSQNPSSKALAYYCQARLSGDNITIIKKKINYLVLTSFIEVRNNKYIYYYKYYYNYYIFIFNKRYFTFMAYIRKYIIII